MWLLQSYIGNRINLLSENYISKVIATWIIYLLRYKLDKRVKSIYVQNFIQRRVIMKKYGVLLVSLALFFATGAAIGMKKGQDYVEVHLKNNLKGDSIRIKNKIIKSGQTEIVGDSTDTALFSRVFKEGGTVFDDKSIEFKEELKNMYKHPNAFLLVTVSPGYFGQWKYTWDWVVSYDLKEKIPVKILSEETTSLPSEIKTEIAHKTLRLILDEAEDNSLLLEKTDKFKEMFSMLGLDASPKAKLKYIDLISMLLKNGANPKTKSYKGNTILHLLVREARLDKETKFSLVKFFVKLGVDVNAKNNEGNTIAHELLKRIAQRSWISNNLFELLAKQYGLNLTVKNNAGDTPFDLLEKMVRNGEWQMEHSVLDDLRSLKK